LGGIDFGSQKMATRKRVAVEPALGEFDDLESGSDRSFGFVLAVALTIIGLWPLLDGRSPRFWAIGLACAFYLAAISAPRILGPLKSVWTRFGELLHRIVTPVVMGIVFVLVVIPIATIMKALNKDLLRLKYDHDAESYWIERQPPGPNPEMMTRQY
jgi:Saxitoxin biosynthesis operon protein SxtJ